MDHRSPSVAIHTNSPIKRHSQVCLASSPPDPSVGNLKNACSLFDDASNLDLALLESVDVNRGLPKSSAIPHSLDSTSPRSCLPLGDSMTTRSPLSLVDDICGTPLSADAPLPLDSSTL